MNKTMRDVRNLINSKKFVDNVSLISIRGIDYLLVGSRAKAISTWNWAYDQVNSLEVMPEVFKGGELTDEQLASGGEIVIEAEMPETPTSKALKEAGY